MKTFFQGTSAISLMFLTLSMIIVSFVSLSDEPLRHPLTTEGLLDIIGHQTVLLAIYLICKIGIYVCNTYKFNVEKKR